MKKKLRCFISYCHEDTNPTIISTLYNQLNNNENIEFIIDQNLKGGSNFNDFMQLINDIEAIIVLLTPSYKKKVEERVKSGVYDEFQMILDRVEKQDIALRTKASKKLKKFAFLPILFSRNVEDSCPSLFKPYKFLNFSDYQINKYNKLYPSLESKYSKLFSEIFETINLIPSLNSREVKINFQEKLNELFLDTKHDNISKTKTWESKELYVKTKAYENVLSQQTYFFLGRKGSGKSTLGTMLFNLNMENFKGLIDLNVDSLNMEYLFNIILNSSLKDDLGVVMPFSHYFQANWEILIYVQSFFVLVKEKKNGSLTEVQAKEVQIIEDWLKIFKTQDNQIHINALFQWCAAEVINYYQVSLKQTRDEKSLFHYDLTQMLQPEGFVKKILPENVLNAFNKVLKNCDRNFLISFDGFDSLFEKFRIGTLQHSIDEEIRQKRVQLEFSFLEGFIDLIIQIKANKNHSLFYKKVSVCVTVPKDRFLEIKNQKRDSYRLIGKFKELKWSGVELAILLRKRLELLFDLESDKNDSPRKRFEYIISKTISSLPSETEIFLNSTRHSKETFLNVLRHSFWRPREVITYYAKFIAIINDLEKRNLKPGNFTLSKIISDTTFEIIENEFLGEFEHYCTNLRSVLKMFKDSMQTLSLLELTDLLSQKAFSFIDNPNERNFNKKVSFLYEIGFLGINVSEQIKKRIKLGSSEIFCFSENNKAFERLAADDFEGCHFIIHPIFFEYLGLNHVGMDKLSLNYSWDYIMEQDIYVK